MGGGILNGNLNVNMYLKIDSLVSLERFPELSNWERLCSTVEYALYCRGYHQYFEGVPSVLWGMFGTVEDF